MKQYCEVVNLSSVFLESNGREVFSDSSLTMGNEQGWGGQIWKLIAGVDGWVAAECEMVALFVGHSALRYRPVHQSASTQVLEVAGCKQC